MSEEESPTPDLVELWRRVVDALNSGDFDAVMSFYAPDADVDSMAMATGFEGVAAIRGLFEDSPATYLALLGENLPLARQRTM
jgi:ketosteroid isomerase-like protein